MSEDLLRRARRQAAAEGRTLASLIEEGLRLVVAEERVPAREERVLPRVSTATGGPVPGIDVTDFSTLQEMDDLEYIERMKQFR